MPIVRPIQRIVCSFQCPAGIRPFRPRPGWLEERHSTALELFDGGFSPESLSRVRR